MNHMDAYWNVTGALDLLPSIPISVDQKQRARHVLDGAVHGVTNVWSDETLGEIRDLMHSPKFWVYLSADAFIKAYGGNYVLGQQEGKLNLVKGSPHTPLTHKVWLGHNVVYELIHGIKPPEPGFNTLIFGLNLRGSCFHYHQDTIGELKAKNGNSCLRQLHMRTHTPTNIQQLIEKNMNRIISHAEEQSRTHPYRRIEGHRLHPNDVKFIHLHRWSSIMGVEKSREIAAAKKDGTWVGQVVPQVTTSKKRKRTPTLCDDVNCMKPAVNLGVCYDHGAPRNSSVEITRNSTVEQRKKATQHLHSVEVQAKKQNTDDAKWTTKFNKLEAFQAVNGNLNVPKGHELYTWTYDQRRANLSDERIASLDGLGFVWRQEAAEAATERVGATRDGDGEELNDVQQELRSARERHNEAERLRYHANRQKREDAACVETDHPFDRRELDNSYPCTLCNELFSTSGNMKIHTKNKKCFKSVVGDDRDVLLNNISETMTKPLGIQATAHRFEVTFPPGLLKVDIEERNMMCVVHQVNNTDEDFPLCANDIIVSVSDKSMAKYEGKHDIFVNVFKGLVSKTKKVVILRYTTKQ